MAEIHHSDASLPRRGGALVFDERFEHGYWSAADGRTWIAPVAVDGLLLVDDRRPADHTPPGLIDQDLSEDGRNFCPAGREPIVVARELGGAYWRFGANEAFAECEATGRLDFDEAGLSEDWWLDDETLAAKKRACAVLDRAARR